MPSQIESIQFITPLGLTFGLAMSVLILVLPRRWALVPVFALTCYMTLGQRLILTGLDFTMLRILILFALMRILLRGEFWKIQTNIIDITMVSYIAFSIVTYTIMWGTLDAFVNRLGRAYDGLGLYFIFRCLVRSTDEVKHVFRILAVMVVPLAAAMLQERATRFNIFSIFGGVSSWTLERDGVLRCQGPFGHPILAGTFGATLLPFFVFLWWHGKDRLKAILGIASAAAIALTTGSSTPVLSALAGMGAVFLWPLRQNMGRFRWGVLLILVSLQMAMKVPVWFLIGRVNVFSGSTGYHRAILIDSAVRNLPEWWLLGTKSTAHWYGHNMWDVTNHFVQVGVDGGLFTLLLFIFVLVHCFRGIGFALKELGYERGSDQKCLWALGAALFAHMATFLAVSYFDQNIVPLSLVLAAIASSTTFYFPVRRTVPVHRPLPETREKATQARG